MSDPYFADDLLERWARQEPSRIPASLSVRSLWYRRIMFEILRRALPDGRTRVLSLGAGTGRLECYLVDRGFSVVASDVNPTALRLCRDSGLDTVLYDVTAPPPPALGAFDAIYADGLLGHFVGNAPLDRFWQSAGDLCRSAGVLLVSNDLADDDSAPQYGVHGNPEAQFHRPPAGVFGSAAVRSGQWRQEWCRVLTYRRPGRGLRRRELIVLRAAH
jgi:SAM-dependent methyltransferase